MEFLRQVLLYAHLIGFAILLGGAVAQLLNRPLRMNRAMLWGSAVQVVTGLALAAPLRGGGDAEPAPAKLAVKLVIAVLIAIAVWASRKRAEVSTGHFWSVIGMTLVNAGVAVFWQ